MLKLLPVHTANITGDTANTGIVEYASRLSKTQQTQDSRFVGRFLSNCPSATIKTPPEWLDIYTADRVPAQMMQDFTEHNEQHMRNLLESEAAAHQAKLVLVPHLGGRTGFQISPELLRDYTNVVISHEFSRLSNEQKRIRLQQLMAADSVLFTTESERENTIQAMQQTVSNKASRELEEKSSLYPVPANITPDGEIPPISERSKKDIVVFGMIKKDKGLDKLPDIALAMKNDPDFQNREIHVMGTVLSQGGNGHKILQDYLIPAIYPGVLVDDVRGLNAEETIRLVKILESKAIVPSKDSLSENLNSVLSKIGVRSGEIPAFERKIPIYLHLNQTDAEISQALKSNLYSFLPMPRGATDHSGTLAASLAHHMITFTKRNETETSSSLSNGSVNLLDKPEDIILAIKNHELQARLNPLFETEMIAKGDKYREARSWDTLADHLNSLIRLSVQSREPAKVLVTQS
ncbi:MAG: hypothetical protein ACOYK1_05245 [Vampirovibrionia bacterium]